MLSADILLFFAAGGAAVERMMRSMKEVKPGWNNDKTEMIYPPSLVFDVDDNLDYVHPFNHTFVRFGIRAFGGQQLKPGDMLTTTLGDGTEVVIWEDKKTHIDNETFDIQRNWNTVARIHNIARMCDGVTVPSTYLANYYREVHKCQNVYVFPNSVVPEDYPTARLQPHEGIRILWQGGGSHMVDWFPLRDAVRTIALKYPQVKFIIWGSAYRWVHDNIPEAQLELHDWVDYEAYRPTRVLMDADINLCPLRDNEFNNSKSAIKWYEGCMPAMPEATLAGNAGPYQEEMKDGETGLLYRTPEEFVEKLSILIENAELRRKLAESGKEWVLDNRHYSKTIPGLMDFYRELRAKKRTVLDA